MDRRLFVAGGLLLALGCHGDQGPTELEEPLVLLPADLCGDHPAGTVVTFDDANLEGAIRAGLSAGARDRLTCGLLSGLTSLSATTAGIESLGGIQNLAGLESLALHLNPISDVTLLGGLTSLTHLDIFGTGITDIAPLRGLTNLEFLDLSINRDLSDIQALLDNSGLSAGDTVNLVLTSVGCQDIAQLSAAGVTVMVDPPALSRATLVGGYRNTSYTETIPPATGCHSAVTYAVTDGSLPEGLSLEPSTGAITGVPTEPGMSYFVVTATGSSPQPQGPRLDWLSASTVYTITISTNPPEGFNMWGSNSHSVRDIPSAAVREQIDAVLARWEEIVTSELPDVTLGAGAGWACRVGTTTAVDGVFVDDVIMFIGINTIDGAGSVVGTSGPCWFDEAPPFTIAGTVFLDFFELVFTKEIEGQDLFSLLWHEIGHAMGIGSYWNILSYLVDEGGLDPRYIGPGAVLEYGNLLGQTVTSVELADQGGFGSRDVHWREAIFGTEIMSPRLDLAVTNPISRMTLGALEDIGWSVDLSKADPYFLPGCQGSCPPAAPPHAAPPAWELPLDLPGGTQARGR